MSWKIAVGILALFYVAFLLPRYIIKEKRNGIEHAVAPKLALSAVFCLVGLLGVLAQSGSVFSLLIFGGLLFSLLGDYYLVFVESDCRKFIVGVLSFSVAQILYIAAMILKKGLSQWEFLAAAVILAVFLAFQVKCKPDMEKAAIPLTVYALLVIFMASKATVMLAFPAFQMTAQILFSAGALLFLISDSFLGLWRYTAHKHIFRNVVSICYFTGQLMIASSLLFE